MRGAALMGMAGLVLALGGCAVATSTYNDASSSAGAIVGSFGGSTTPGVALVPPPPVPAPSLGSFLEGPAGTRLADADRQRAFQAEQDALAAGDRRTWRGLKGTYGFVAPSGSPTPEGCRDFSHTIYIAGRPVSGKGTGCKAPDGTWRITG